MQPAVNRPNFCTTSTAAELAKYAHDGQSAGSTASGRVPNLEWDAMSIESFREQPELTALPEVQHFEISGTESYRQVWSLILATPSSTPQIPGRLHQR